MSHKQACTLTRSNTGSLGAVTLVLGHARMELTRLKKRCVRPLTKPASGNVEHGYSGCSVHVLAQRGT